ncbi:hypothetical protein ABT112_33985 [Streptomyces sp. NPDC002055]|uniref:hypothetical protein n=1 Tax=Streptomyces sp. NPDC002055 TaxID=3154534 RepID=UPI0033270448
MSLGDDGYGTGYPDDGPGAGRQTRTRLPEGAGGDGYDDGRRSRTAARPSKGMITVVGVVVLLIAAIAFANRGGGKKESGEEPGGSGAQSQPTAPTGEKPVTGSQAGIASGFPKTKQGAQSAAANYAVALGGDGMFRTETRRRIVNAVAAPEARGGLQSGFDSDYNKSLLSSIGLKADGSSPEGMTFVNRTVPVGTTIKRFGDTAEVEVWCTGLFGLAGEGSTKPVTSNWYTVTVKLRWTDSDWKVLKTDQKQGPTPVTGDNPVSGADEIAGAVDGYGGFTYAR